MHLGTWGQGKPSRSQSRWAGRQQLLQVCPALPQAGLAKEEPALALQPPRPGTSGVPTPPELNLSSNTLGAPESPTLAGPAQQPVVKARAEIHLCPGGDSERLPRPEMLLLLVNTGDFVSSVPKFFRGHKQVTSQAHTHSPCLLPATLFRNNPFNQDLQFLKAN